MLHEQQETISMRSNVQKGTQIFLVDTPFLHLPSILFARVQEYIKSSVELEYVQCVPKLCMNANIIFRIILCIRLFGTYSRLLGGGGG